MVCSCAQSDPADTASGTPPNIVLFIADDWSYPHAGAYGNTTLRTPAFDALAAGGMLFTNAYCAAPSCAPSRASILTGRYPHQNGVAGNLWSEFPRELVTYTEELERAGYLVGHDQKGWAPGDWRTPGREHNPAGKRYANIREMLEGKEAGQPFCFWFGSSDPHRVYEPNLGVKTGLKPDSVKVPPFLPDLPCVRNDILDYFAEVERFDRHVGLVVELLRERGELENTLIVVTSDNGMPFPRAKANLYDAGSRMPFVVHWPARVPAGTRRDSYVSLAALAPTFLDAAGLAIPREMTHRSLLPQLLDEGYPGFADVIIERERHAQVRADSGSYAMRGLRNDSFLYVRNYYPDRWPAGDPEVVRSVGAYGDVDNSIGKVLILRGVHPPGDETDYYSLAFGKRPAEELYDLSTDPQQLRNVATLPGYADQLGILRERLNGRLTETGDPRTETPQTPFWDTARYPPTYGPATFDADAYLRDYRYGVLRGPTSFTYAGCLE
ncbi:sulfatase [Lewinella sp. W8]|uniref:sulfatase family protein n=1 Tax=Lewinella sp. W8 TaxID=2528208 RepID=UPI001C12B332|nr:sulfatase [Lewinella sp. W8]